MVAHYYCYSKQHFYGARIKYVSGQILIRKVNAFVRTCYAEHRNFGLG